MISCFSTLRSTGLPVDAVGKLPTKRKRSVISCLLETFPQRKSTVQLVARMRFRVVFLVFNSTYYYCCIYV